LVVLTLTGGYLYAFPSATIPYLAVVLSHVAAGFIFAAFLPTVLRRIRSLPFTQAVGWLFVAAGGAIGISLTFTGATRPFAAIFYAHILTCAIGLIFVATRRPSRLALLAITVIAAGSGAWAAREIGWRSSHRIHNPAMPPE